MLHPTIRRKVGMAAVLIGLVPIMAACQMKAAGGNGPTATATTTNTKPVQAADKARSREELRALLTADDSTLTLDQKQEKAILQAKIGGAIALKQNKHEAADKLFSLGLALDPENHELLAGRAVALQLLNRHRVAIPVLDKFLAVSKTKDQATQALALRMLAENRVSLGRSKEAMRYYTLALEKYPEKTGNVVSRIDILSKLGAMHGKNRNIGKAEQYLEQARKLAERHDNRVRLVDIRIKQGRLLHKSGKLVEAEKAFQETLRLAEEGGFDKHAASSLANLGLVAKDELQYKLALDYLTRAAARYGRAKNADIGRAYAYSHIAQIHKSRDRLAEAEKYFDRSTAIFKRKNLRSQLAGNLIATGHIALKTGNLQKACSRWRQAEQIYQDYRAKQEAVIVRALTATMCKDVGQTS